MDSLAIRSFLRGLALSSREAWENLGDTVFFGETFLATEHTTYGFRNGVCCSVTGKRGAKDIPFVSMRLVGWLTLNGGTYSLSQAWEKGTCAVLWKPGIGNGTVALTSATTEWRRPVPKPVESSIVLKKGLQGPLVKRPSYGSMTRLHATSGGACPSLLPRPPRPSKA